MPNQPHYGCTNPDCLSPDVDRELLTVKKVVFLEMGEGGRTVKSRVTAWLCPTCTATDPDWNREKFNPPRPQGFLPPLMKDAVV